MDHDLAERIQRRVAEVSLAGREREFKEQGRALGWCGLFLLGAIVLAWNEHEHTLSLHELVRQHVEYESCLISVHGIWSACDDQVPDKDR